MCLITIIKDWKKILFFTKYIRKIFQDRIPSLVHSHTIRSAQRLSQFPWLAQLSRLPQSAQRDMPTLTPHARDSTTVVSDNFLTHMPKAELHLHIEGTLEPTMMLELAHRNKIQLPYRSIDEITKAYNFSCLQDFLDIYYAGARVLRTEEDFYELGLAYFARCHENSIVHAEIFFDPQTHTLRGVPFSHIISGLWSAHNIAYERWGITSNFIMCFLRHLSQKSALATLTAALPYRDKIAGVGLDSTEVGNPPEKFVDVFARAREYGFRCVAHAGEEAPAEYIWKTLHFLSAERIDHGVTCYLDPQLIHYLRTHKIPLTVCPLSNVKLNVFPKLSDHILLQLLDQQICITINSDDPAYFGGYLNDNFYAINHALSLTKAQAIQLARNSFSASFISEDYRTRLYHRLESYVAHYDEQQH